MASIGAPIEPMKLTTDFCKRAVHAGGSTGDRRAFTYNWNSDICVVGALCFRLIDKFVNEGRFDNLLKLLVVLVCLAAILQRVLPLAEINWL